MDVENVVDSEFDGVDVGDDFLELVRGSAAFGEVADEPSGVDGDGGSKGGSNGGARGGSGDGGGR